MMKKVLGFLVCTAVSCAVIFAGCKQAYKSVNDILSNIPAQNESSSPVSSEPVKEKPASADTSSTQSQTSQPTQSRVSSDTQSEPASEKSKFYWHSYENLNERQRSYYMRIFSAVSSVVTEQVFIAEHGSDDDFERNMRLAFAGVMADHPELFWADGSFTTYSLNGTQDKYAVFGYTIADKADIERKKSALKATLSALCSQVEDLSPFEQEVFFHNYLCTNVKYSEDAQLCRTAYGAIMNGRATCEGYAKAMQLLLNGVKVNCITVGGKSENVPHMWNMVELSGAWYHLDVTWNDTDKGTVYKYFNLTDEQMYKSHIPETRVDLSTDAQTIVKLGISFNFCLPKATGTYYTASRIK